MQVRIQGFKLLLFNSSKYPHEEIFIFQVVKEARKLGKILDLQNANKDGGGGNFDVMTLLDGGSLTRQKIWLKVLILLNICLTLLTIDLQNI